MGTIIISCNAPYPAASHEGSLTSCGPLFQGPVKVSFFGGGVTQEEAKQQQKDYARPDKKKSQINSWACELPGQLQESFGPFGPGVSRGVFRESPRSVRETFLTLWGHSRESFWTLRSLGPEGPWRHPWDTPSDTPRFQGTLP